MARSSQRSVATPCPREEREKEKKKTKKKNTGPKRTMLRRGRESARRERGEARMARAKVKLALDTERPPPSFPRDPATLISEKLGCRHTSRDVTRRLESVTQVPLRRSTIDSRRLLCPRAIEEVKITDAVDQRETSTLSEPSMTTHDVTARRIVPPFPREIARTIERAAIVWTRRSEKFGKIRDNRILKIYRN